MRGNSATEGGPSAERVQQILARAEELSADLHTTVRELVNVLSARDDSEAESTSSGADSDSGEGA